MKKADVEVGGRYIAKVSGTLTTVRIDRENPHGGWDATNMETRRTVRIRSAARLRRRATTPGRLEEERERRRRIVAPEPEVCPACKGTGAEPGSDNVNWLPCTSCRK